LVKCVSLEIRLPVPLTDRCGRIAVSGDDDDNDDDGDDGDDDDSNVYADKKTRGVEKSILYM
jgi:hypothetical protein